MSVLDLGCGLGDNALCLQQLGVGSRVTAVDRSSVALDVARAKEALRLDRMPGAVKWLQLDLLSRKAVTSAFGHQLFDVLLDCATLHTLTPPEQPVYLENVSRLCKPGGHLYLLAFADKSPGPREGWPRALGLPGIHACLNEGSGWEVQQVLETMLEHHPSIHMARGQAEAADELDVGGPAPGSPAAERIWRGHVESYLVVAERLPSPAASPRPGVWSANGTTLLPATQEDGLSADDEHSVPPPCGS